MDSRALVSDTLLESAGGARPSAERLLVAVYRQLRALAASHLKRERANHTLQPTELVHEAFLRLVEIDRVNWSGRTHFLAMASRQMRRILVDHARRVGAQKRGGQMTRVTLADLHDQGGRDALHVIALDEALSGLAKAHPRQARVAEMRLFAGMSVEEIAAELQVSPRTVKSDWRLARAWIARTLGEGDSPDPANES